MQCTLLPHPIPSHPQPRWTSAPELVFKQSQEWWLPEAGFDWIWWPTHWNIYCIPLASALQLPNLHSQPTTCTRLQIPHALGLQLSYCCEKQLYNLCPHYHSLAHNNSALRAEGIGMQLCSYSANINLAFRIRMSPLVWCLAGLQLVRMGTND